MELRQLVYFVTIAESGSFSEASRKCFISQSAISQQIRQLEEELQTSLFDRNPHKVSLTESGAELLPMAQKILGEVNECRKRVSDFNGMLLGEVSVGLTYSLESYVRNVVAQFMRAYPHVRLNIYYKTIPELIHLLRQGQIDMALSIIVRGEVDWVDSYRLMDYRICAVMRSTHPIAARKSLTFKELMHQKVVLPEGSIRDNNAVEHYLSEAAGMLRPRAVINDACAILNLLKHTNCVSILPEHFATDDRELCAVPIDELSQPFAFYCHFVKGAYRKRAATVFFDLLKKEMGK